MSIAQFVDFKRIERGGSLRPEGVTMLFCARADRELAIIFEGHRSTQNQYLHE